MKKRIILVLFFFSVISQLHAADTYFIHLESEFKGSSSWECFFACDGPAATCDPYSTDCEWLEELRTTITVLGAPNSDGTANVLARVNGPNETAAWEETVSFLERPVSLIYSYSYCIVIDIDEVSTSCEQSSGTSVAISSTGSCITRSQNTSMYEMDAYFVEFSLEDATEAICNEESFAFSGPCTNVVYQWEDGIAETDAFGNVLPIDYSIATTTTGTQSKSFLLGNLLPNEHFTGNYSIRANLSFDGGTTFPFTSEAGGTEINGCSPKLNDIEGIKASCSNIDDGGFKMELDRELVDSRILIVSVYDEDLTNPGTFKFLTQSDTDELDEIGTDKYEYIWEGIGLGKGNYLVRYQSYLTTTNTSNIGNTGTFESLESHEFSIDAPDPFLFSLNSGNVTDVTCYDGSDGRIVLSASGGSNSYLYTLTSGSSWPALNSSKTISGLEAKTYTLKVRDTNGCKYLDGDGDEVSVPFEIDEPDEIVVSSSSLLVKDADCFGSTDGAIDITVEGGAGGYSYTWSNGTTTQDLSGIIAGTYTVQIQDSDNCSITSNNIIVDEPAQLALASRTINDVSCYGYEDGSIEDVVFEGGNGSYSYTWLDEDSNPLSTTTGDITLLKAGDYRLALTDSKSCTTNPATIRLNVPEPDLLEFTLTEDPVKCNEGSDGALTIEVTGGNGGYTYDFNFTGMTAMTGTSHTISGLSKATYFVDVEDNLGCETLGSQSLAVTEPDEPITITYGFEQPTHTGGTNGNLVATIAGGTQTTAGTYSYVWTDEAGDNLNSQVTATALAGNYQATLDGIGSGTYYLTVEDANYDAATTQENCTVVASDQFLNEPEPLVASIAIETEISCNSTNLYGDPSDDGVLEVTAVGGVQLQPEDNDGLPYYYTWKKQNNEGVWEVLTGQNTNLATGLEDGNYAVNIADQNGIVLGVYENNILTEAQDETFLFNEPDLLSVNLSKLDVYCYEGSDGWVEVNISGGTSSYETEWSTGDLTLRAEALPADTYTAEVTDSRDCFVDASIEVNQPEAPLFITYHAFGRPSTGGASDGWVEAQITGGTAFTDESYRYYWVDADNNPLNVQTTTSFTTDAIFQIRLSNIPKGAYKLTVEDGAFDLATTSTGCTFIESEFNLYDPIEGSLAVSKPVSCNQYNLFDNPSSDGQIQAAITGGFPFDTGDPYVFHWKKLNETTGFYEELSEQTGVEAKSLSTGYYALNVEDALGNIMGVYDSYALSEAVDLLYYFEEPDLFEVNLTSTPITCDAGNDGTANISISGGIADYVVEWSNGANTLAIEDLIAGRYIAYLTDARGCETTGQVVVDQPGGLEIEVRSQVDPTCYLGAEGTIAVEVSGGEIPYQYLWEDGSTLATHNDLTAGSYVFEITDNKDCKAFAEIILNDPEPIEIELGPDRTLCLDQSHDLEISIADVGASYQWQSDQGYSSSAGAVSLTDAGQYIAILTTGEGCIGRDTINITTSVTDIDAQFLVSTQAFAGEEIYMINTSNPLSDNVTWVLPPEATLVSQSEASLTLQFDSEGSYALTMRSLVEACYQDYTKTITVQEARILADIGDAEDPFIQEYSAYPNPSNGSFTVAVSLSEPATISLRLFNLVSNAAMDDKIESGKSEYEITYDMQLPAGIYYLLLETPKSNEIRKVILE